MRCHCLPAAAAAPVSAPHQDRPHTPNTRPQVEAAEPLMAAGLDSLGAVELRNALEGALRVPLPPTLAFDYPTAAAIADLAAERLAAGACAR